MSVLRPRVALAGCGAAACASSSSSLVLALLTVSFVAVGARHRDRAARLPDRPARPAARRRRQPVLASASNTRTTTTPTTTRQFGTVAGPGRRHARRPGPQRPVTAADIVAHDQDDQPSVSAADKQVLARLQPIEPAAHRSTCPTWASTACTVTAGDDGDLLVTGLPEHPVDDTIARLLLIEAGVFAVALLVDRRRGDGQRAAVAAPAAPGRRHRPRGVASCRCPPARCRCPSGPTVDRTADRGRAGRRRVQPHARTRRVGPARPARQRGPAAPLRRRRQPRTAHAGRRRPQPRRVRPTSRRRPTRAGRRGAGADHGRSPIGWATSSTTCCCSPASTPAARSRTSRSTSPGSCSTRSATPGCTRSEPPLATRPARGRGVRRRRRARAAPGRRQPAGQRAHSHPDAERPSRPPCATRGRGRDRRRARRRARDPRRTSSPRIFDRFVRADSARAGETGSGLGLAIVAAIVAAHDGTVEVDSRPGLDDVHRHAAASRL